MANTLVNSTLVTKESAFGYVNRLRFASRIDRRWEKGFQDKGIGKVGDTILIRMPVRFEPKEGQAYQAQGIFEQTVPLSIDKQFQVGMGWSSSQATLNLEEIRSRYIKPATQTLANQADVYCYTKVFLDVFNVVGTPGTTPNSLLTYEQAVVKLVNQAADDDRLMACLHPLSMATIANANATLFNPVGSISEAYRTGQQPDNSLGIRNWYREANVQSYTTGSYSASTPLVNGASQSGASIITDGWTSASLKKGDCFTIGGVYTLNPVSYSNTAQLQDFVVTSDVSDSGGNMTINISPSIITTGSLRTVSASPADNAVITVRGASNPAGGTLTATLSPQNLVFQKEAFTFVNVDLIRPAGGVDCEFVQDDDWGLSMRFLSGYDMMNDQNPSRLDILGGAATVQARLAARVYA
jgi:hypothetical protein